MKKFPVILGGYEKIVHLFEIHSAPPPGIKNDHPLTRDVNVAPKLVMAEILTILTFIRW